MKKILISILSLVLIVGFSSVNACETCGCKNKDKEIKEACPFTKNEKGELICVKTGKICDDSCKNKKNGTCCKGGKAKKSSCSKSANVNGFNFGKSNNYGNNQSSCSKSANKGCCKKKSSCSKSANKACCKKKSSCSKSEDTDNEEVEEETTESEE